MDSIGEHECNPFSVALEVASESLPLASASAD